MGKEVVIIFFLTYFTRCSSYFRSWAYQIKRSLTHQIHLQGAFRYIHNVDFILCILLIGSWRKGDSSLHQFHPRGRSELVRAYARKRIHKTFRSLWRSRARHGSRNHFYFHGVSATTKAHGKSCALKSSLRPRG